MSQNMKLIGVKMPPETHEAILQAASVAGISVSQFCREKLERAVKVDPTSVMVREELEGFCKFLAGLTKTGEHSVESTIRAMAAYFKEGHA